MKENINFNNFIKAEIIHSVRSKNIEELRGLIESGKGSVEDSIKLQILQDRVRNNMIGQK